MPDLITTFEGLEALEPGDVVLDADGDWMVKGFDDEMHQLQWGEEGSPCHLPARRICPHAEPTAPTVQPSREQIGQALSGMVGCCVDCRTRHPESDLREQAEEIADAILALLPGRTEAEVKAEAWDEGYRAGHSRAMRLMSDEPSVSRGVNPYLLAGGEPGE